MSFTVGKIEEAAPYLMADLLELIVALGIDGRSSYSPADMVSFLTGSPGIANISADALEDEIREAFLHIGYREARFGTLYPFRLVNNALSEKAKSSAGARIYKLLLANSRLKSFNAPLRATWASMFARVSKECLAQLMPPDAYVKIFDANSDDRRAYYGTNLRNALPILASDLKLSYFDEEEIQRLHHAGDGGIDLVAIANWNDDAEGTLVILGQCAAQQSNWPDKRFEASSASLRGIFHFLCEPLNTLFIPLLYRQNNGGWFSKKAVGGVLVVDRLRFMLLLERRAVQNRIIAQTWFTRFETEFSAVATTVANSVA